MNREGRDAHLIHFSRCVPLLGRQSTNSFFQNRPSPFFASAQDETCKDRPSSQPTPAPAVPPPPAMRPGAIRSAAPAPGRRSEGASSLFGRFGIVQSERRRPKTPNMQGPAMVRRPTQNPALNPLGGGEVPSVAVTGGTSPEEGRRMGGAAPRNPNSARKAWLRTFGPFSFSSWVVNNKGLLFLHLGIQMIDKR